MTIIEIIGSLIKVKYVSKSCPDHIIAAKYFYLTTLGQ